MDEPQTINLPQSIDELQVHYSTTGQFKGRGPNNAHKEHNSTVSMILKMESQLNLWLRNQKDEGISHQCKDLFNKLSTKDDISNIDTLMEGAIEFITSKLPIRDNTSNISKLPVKAIESTSRTFTGSGRPQVTVIYLSVEANYIHHKVAYTVKCVSHKKRELVFTINGMDKCKCSSIRASEKRILQTKKLLNSFVSCPAFVIG